MTCSVEESDHKSGVKHWWIIGGLGGGLAVILAVVAVFVCARTSSFWCRSGRLCCNSDDWRRTNTIEESSDRHINIPKGLDFSLCCFRLWGCLDCSGKQKPVVFAYEEVLSCTDLFSESNLLGHGTYGSMYYGLLREQVELIGITASDDELFLIYEYAQKGSLRSHIHEPQSKGNCNIREFSKF
ncbi:LysM domain receptor-like kinase 3 [Tanacetum coccineum]